MTVACTGALTATTNVMTASVSVGLVGILGENNVVLPSQLTDIYCEG